MSEIQTRSIKERPVKEDIPEVSVKDISAEDRLLNFVDKQIEKMKKYTQLGNSGGMPGFYELNQALMDYSGIQASLISLDVLAKVEYDQATEAFKDWQSEKYMEAREILCPMNVSAAKWASGAEIDAYVRVHYRDTYQKLHKEMVMAEAKLAAIRRILDSWNTQSLILNRLCKNVEAEMLSTTNGNNLGLNN